MSRWLAGITEGGPVGALLILFGLNAMAQVDSTGFGILIPNIRDAFGMTNAGILSLVAVAALVGLSMQVPIAQLADRRNRTRLMLVGAVVAAAFSVGTGLAVSVAVLAAMRAGTGIGMATVGPTHNSLLADWFPINARPKVYAFHYAALAVGGVVGPVVAGSLAAAFSWRVPFFVFAVPVALLVLLGLRLHEPSRGIEERRAMGVVEALETEEPPPSFSEGWRMTWKIASLRRIFCALPFLAASLIGFSSLASLLYQHKFGLDVAARGWVAAAAEPTQLVGLVVGARVGRRLIERDPGLIIRFLAVVAVGCGALLTLFATVPVLWLTVVCNMAVTAALAAVAAGIYSSLSLAVPARSRSLGYSMGAVWVIPGLLVLPIVGAVSDAAGIEAGMLMMVPVFVVGGWILSTAGRVIDGDIAQVRTMSAARSEVLFARRHGQVKLLLVRGLDVSYDNVQVLFGVDLDVGEGEIVALLGTNGAGKSTLLRSICGVVEADRGAVVFDGRDVTHAPPHEIAALGVTEVPGGQGVFPGLTVGENLRVALWLERRRRAEARRRLAESLEMFPALAGRLEEPAANLSGGQQQMLALAMAFLSRPRLLLVDELTLGLAPSSSSSCSPLSSASAPGARPWSSSSSRSTSPSRWPRRRTSWRRARSASTGRRRSSSSDRTSSGRCSSRERAPGPQPGHRPRGTGRGERDVHPGAAFRRTSRLRRQPGRQRPGCQLPPPPRRGPAASRPPRSRSARSQCSSAVSRPSAASPSSSAGARCSVSSGRTVPARRPSST